MFLKMEKKYLYLWVMAILCSLSAIAYSYFLGLFPAKVNFPKLILFSAGQSVVLNLCLVLAIRFFLYRVDFSPLKISTNKPSLFWNILNSSMIGSWSVLFVCILDKTLFKNEALNLMMKSSPKTIPFFVKFLACFYGGFYEEFLCRLFLCSGLYYLCSFFSNSKNSKIGFSVVFTSLLFGVGHLPALFGLITTPTFFSIFRIIFLNFLPGFIFGLLYFKKGFFSAIVAHFSADVMLHLILSNF